MKSESDVMTKQENIPVKPEKVDAGAESFVETAEDLENFENSKIADATGKIEDIKTESEQRVGHANDSIGLSPEKVQEIKNSGNIGKEMMTNYEAGNKLILEMKAKMMAESGGVDLRAKYEEQNKAKDEQMKEMFQKGMANLEEQKNQAIENASGKTESAPNEQGKLKSAAEIAMEKTSASATKTENIETGKIENSEEATAGKAEVGAEVKTENVETTKLKTAAEIAMEKAKKLANEENEKKKQEESGKKGPDLTTAEKRQSHINSQESDYEKTVKEIDNKPETLEERNQKIINATESDYEKTVKEIDNKPETLEEKNQKVINATESDYEKAVKEIDQSKDSEKVPEAKEKTEKKDDISEKIKGINSEEDLYNFLDSVEGIQGTKDFFNKEELINTAKWSIGMLEKVGLEDQKAVDNVLKFSTRTGGFRDKIYEIARKKMLENKNEETEEKQSPETAKTNEEINGEKSKEKLSPEAVKIDKIMSGEKTGESKETKKEKSLREIGQERRAMILEKGKKTWEGLKASLSKSGEWIKEKSVGAVDYALASPEAVKRGAKIAKEGAIDVMTKVSEGMDALADRGHKAFENLITRTSAAKNKFFDYINQKRIERLNKKEAKNKKKLDEIMKKKIYPLQSRMDEIRKRKAKIASRIKG